MRLLHAADIHIGMENYGRINPASGLSTRLEDFCQTLDEAVDYAIGERVDLVLLAGDIYRSRDPSPTHQREFAARIAKLIQAEIPVFIAPGNHDLPLAANRASSVEVFRQLPLRGVTIARAIGRWTIQTKAGPLQVLALPWVTRSQFLSRDDFKNHTIEELNREMVQRAVARLQQLAAELDPTIPAVLVGHAHVYGARVGAERLLAMGADPVFDVAVLTALPGINYVALGHIHKHQSLSIGQPPVVYSGSINRVDFSEEEEAKGFVVVEIEGGQAEWRFQEVQARRFLTIEARAEGEDPTAEVLRAIERVAERVPEAVVRLRISIFRAMAPLLDEAALRASLREAHFLLPIQKEYLDADRQRATGRDFQGKTPRDVLEAYWESRDVSKERRATLGRYADAIMAEER